MEQRDYLLRQIQQLAQVLTMLIRKLTGLKEDGSETERKVRQTTDEMLYEHLDMELADLLKIPVSDLPDRIREQKGFDAENIELLADVLVLNANAWSFLVRILRCLSGLPNLIFSTLPAITYT